MKSASVDKSKFEALLGDLREKVPAFADIAQVIPSHGKPFALIVVHLAGFGHQFGFVFQ